MHLDKIMNFIPTENLIGKEAFAPLSQLVDWGLIASGIPSAWDFTQGEGVNIAVVDIGVCNHIDLSDNVIARYDTTGEGIDHGGDHATHVAGIIAANANDIGCVGIAPKSKIISIKVLNSNGAGSLKQIIDGLKICEQLDVQIINLSLGIVSKPPQELEDQIKRLYSQGKFIIAAAGNNAGKVNYPAAYNEVIAVAANDKDSHLAKFASHGSEVDALAPGVDIYSTVCQDNYKIMSGSSMAAPFFSGVCALILSYAKAHPEELPINNFEDLLKILDVLCNPDPLVPYAGKLGDTGFGLPSFANNLPWRINV